MHTMNIISKKFSRQKCLCAMDLKGLQNTYLKPGIVETVTIRPKRMDQVVVLEKVMAIENIGLEGDHYDSPGGVRQVTLIQSEHLAAVASMLNLREIAPELTRRNLVVSGINLLSLKGKKFQIGSAVLEYCGECHPCSRMEKNLGVGGYNAMRGHGGITAKVVSGGLIQVGDGVHVLFSGY